MAELCEEADVEATREGLELEGLVHAGTAGHGRRFAVRWGANLRFLNPPTLLVSSSSTLLVEAYQPSVKILPQSEKTTTKKNSRRRRRRRIYE